MDGGGGDGKDIVCNKSKGKGRGVWVGGCICC